MIATIILGVVIFGSFSYVVYTRFIKHQGAKGCHNCDDVGCPLVDPVKINQKKNAGN
ncbi:FeoB-associated Cys-rich membrane protein [Liquorilactobacillus uvarum]|uniref:FeoB-associated Cys-rich membrane protein n=1 Tax=Liquorilactobacillus uvarum TaxID=303240 RepID=UPI00288938D6|nr:FeoB-associated Cys-rich membrane protein [Liquorilactobacillus uvarum]